MGQSPDRRPRTTKLTKGAKVTKRFSRFSPYFGLSWFNSFTAGTPIETDQGQKPIEAIQIGDKVLAEDPDTGDATRGYFEVVAVTNHPTDEILQITVEAEAKAEENTLDAGDEGGHNEDAQLNGDNNPTPEESRHETKSKIQNLNSEMEITPDHPIYVEGQGWLNAENLSIGDRLRRADGGTAKVLAIERVKLDTPEVVYNFTVKGPHTYFVLEAGVLVHNDSIVCSPRRPGLPTRTAAESWKKGQFFDEEFEFFQRFASERQKKIVVAGSLIETDPGLVNRYTLELQPYLPAPWRRNKPYSELIDTGIVRDVDFAEISGLTDDELQEIHNFFQGRFPGVDIEIDQGYSRAKGYANERSFKQVDGGAIVFYPNGRTKRLPASWQRPNWPAPDLLPNSTVKVNDIFYTQDSINRVHQGGFSVENNISLLKNGQLELPPIQVFVKHPDMNKWNPVSRIVRGNKIIGDPKNLMNYRLYSLDNRRLYEFKEAGLTEVTANWISEIKTIQAIPSPKISEMRAVEYDTFFTEQGEKRKGNNRSCQR